MDATHGNFFTAAISKFIETDWFFANKSQANLSTTHEVQNRLERPLRVHANTDNRRLVVDRKNYFFK